MPVRLTNEDNTAGYGQSAFTMTPADAQLVIDVVAEMLLISATYPPSLPSDTDVAIMQIWGRIKMDNTIPSAPIITYNAVTGKRQFGSLDYYYQTFHTAEEFQTHETQICQKFTFTGLAPFFDLPSCDQPPDDSFPYLGGRALTLTPPFFNTGIFVFPPGDVFLMADEIIYTPRVGSNVTIQFSYYYRWVGVNLNAQPVGYQYVTVVGL